MLFLEVDEFEMLAALVTLLGPWLILSWVPARGACLGESQEVDWVFQRPAARNTQLILWLVFLQNFPICPSECARMGPSVHWPISPISCGSLILMAYLL